jgi:hypothetical protein
MGANLSEKPLLLASFRAVVWMSMPSGANWLVVFRADSMEFTYFLSNRFDLS